MHSVSNHKFNTCLFTLGEKNTNASQAHLTNKSQSDLNTYAYSFSPVYAINKNLYWLELSIYYSLHRKGALLCNNVSLGRSFCNAEEKKLFAHKQPPRTKGQGCAPAAFPFQFNSSQVKYSGPFSSAISPLWGPSSITVMSYPYQNAPIPAACKRHWLLFNNYCNCGTAEINCTDGTRFFFFFFYFTKNWVSAWC